jgi:hypothetical protein
MYLIDYKQHEPGETLMTRGCHLCNAFFITLEPSIVNKYCVHPV